jgi:FAD binding domain-containing protein/berberine-like enzyme
MSQSGTTEPRPGVESKIRPDDPRYRATVEKRFNKRFSALPDYVVLAQSTEEIISALELAVREGRRLAVTSGGHCLEGFVSNPGVKVILDVSPMKRIYYDQQMGAVAVEAGATVGETFRALQQNWGTVVPLGEYPAIGMGGHVAGGAFGFLCRQLGLAADYLHAVEVVTVDQEGRARSVIGTREQSQPHHDLWWAHTGGGGGNFGVVTRYWFRSPAASGQEPANILPRAPQSVTTFKVAWSWDQVDRKAFSALLTNHGVWCEQNSSAESRYSSLWTVFEIHRKQFGTVIYRGVSTAGASAEGDWANHLDTLCRGVAQPGSLDLVRSDWLDFALDPIPDLFAMPPGGASVKVKDALLRRRLTARQIDVAYDYLTDESYDAMGGMLGLATYGGRINSVSPEATASSQRGSILDLACSTGWIDPADEARNLLWCRDFYRQLFSDTGGVPVPGQSYDGAFINHPDTDLADPELNTSGVAWPTLYYQRNYPRLQRIKRVYDPLELFRHGLSIEPPGEV